MIRIFALAFNYGDIFSKNKTNVDEGKKENFRMEIVKKGLVFAMIQDTVGEVYPLSIFRTCSVETLKSCINFIFQIL